MQQGSDSNALTWVLGGALGLIGLFVAILLVGANSQADIVSTQTNVTNVAPTVDTLVLKDNGATVGSGGTLTVNSGSTEVVTITGTISDDNGVGTSLVNGDISEIVGKLYRTSLGEGGCNNGAKDNNDCYYENTAGSCALGAPVDSTTINYTCTFNVQYYADGTQVNGVAPADDWTASITVIDDSTESNTSTQAYETGDLLALSIPGSIDYGTLAREQRTTNVNNFDMVITQFGNVAADVEVSGNDMTCSVTGTIPKENQEWSLTDVPAGDPAATALTGSPTDTNFAIGNRTNDGAALTKTLYWNITMPTVASGTCTGSNTITALAS